MAKSKNEDGLITIKKYANRRLYNTATSSYVTLDHLSQMVKDGDDFQVFDAKSGDDITKSVLTQIIFEEEAKGQNLLPIQFLRQLIRFYGDSMQAFVPSYLEMSMDSFTRSQDDLRGRMQDALGTGEAFKGFEEQVKQNVAMFQKTVQMFAPFLPEQDKQPSSTNTAPQRPSAPADMPADIDNKPDEELDTLRTQITRMQEQLDSLSKKN